MTQATISLSSAAAESTAITKGCMEGTCAKNLPEGFTGETNNLELSTDSMHQLLSCMCTEPQDALNNGCPWNQTHAQHVFELTSGSDAAGVFQRVVSSGRGTRGNTKTYVCKSQLFDFCTAPLKRTRYGILDIPRVMAHGM